MLEAKILAETSVNDLMREKGMEAVINCCTVIAPSSLTSTATAISGQHLLQMWPSLPHVLLHRAQEVGRGQDGARQVNKQAPLPDIVVVCQVNVEHQLTLQRDECGCTATWETRRGKFCDGLTYNRQRGSSPPNLRRSWGLHEYTGPMSILDGHLDLMASRRSLPSLMSERVRVRQQSEMRCPPFAEDMSFELTLNDWYLTKMSPSKVKQNSRF